MSIICWHSSSLKKPWYKNALGLQDKTSIHESLRGPACINCGKHAPRSTVTKRQKVQNLAPKAIVSEPDYQLQLVVSRLTQICFLIPELNSLPAPRHGRGFDGSTSLNFQPFLGIRQVRKTCFSLSFLFLQPDCIPFLRRRQVYGARQDLLASDRCAVRDWSRWSCNLLALFHKENPSNHHAYNHQWIESVCSSSP